MGGPLYVEYPVVFFPIVIVTTGICFQKTQIGKENKVCPRTIFTSPMQGQLLAKTPEFSKCFAAPNPHISYHNSSGRCRSCRGAEIKRNCFSPILLSQEIKPFSGLHRFSDDRRNWTLSFIGFPRYRKYIVIEYDEKHETFISSLIFMGCFVKVWKFLRTCGSSRSSKRSKVSCLNFVLHLRCVQMLNGLKYYKFMDQWQVETWRKE